MAYAKEDIERVRQATNLVDLIGATTAVKRTGRSFKAVCPFHQEKTPSLSIDPGKGVYYCFGCGVGGDVFTFVQETQGLDFTEAVDQLASAAGVTLRQDPKAQQRRGERAEAVEAVAAAIRFYSERLRSGQEAGPARAYLRGRGYDVAVVDQFQLGYAPPGWDELLKHLRASGVKDRILVESGLAHRNRQGRLIDYFRGRILFPSFDLRGDPVGFGGRKLEGEGPKYLNSPETSLYQKARLLYGLNLAKSDIARRGYALVVEGYTDVIALHQAGMPTAVATCGTALGEDHFDLLRRFCDRVILAFDADQAGAGAAMRADDLQLPSDLSLDLRVAVMPDGRDPADVVQAGEVELLRKAIDDSEPVMMFRITRELEQYELEEPEGRVRAVRAVAPLVARLDDGLARREYAGLIARRTGVDRQSVTEAIEASFTRRARVTTQGKVEGTPLTGAQKAERELLRVVLANGRGVERLGVSAATFTDSRHRAAFELISGQGVETGSGKPLDLGSALQHRQDPEAMLLRKLAVDASPLADGAELIDRIQRARIDTEIEELRRKLEALPPESEEYSMALGRLIDLEHRKHER
ncbi:MAG TPA: DNA primase [Acidimicrobiia bacterium]